VFILKPKDCWYPPPNDFEWGEAKMPKPRKEGEPPWVIPKVMTNDNFIGYTYTTPKSEKIFREEVKDELLRLVKNYPVPFRFTI
jgi:hypothetical protein